MMNKTAFVLAMAALGLISNESMAQQQSPWRARVRVVDIKPAHHSDQIGGTGAEDRLTVSSKTVPEVDISYFFTPNSAAELILSYPQKHQVYLYDANIGTFKHLPPTLTAQYHFTSDAQFSPYLGAGVNFTSITKVNLLNGAGGLEHKSIGFALQACLDYKIDKNWSHNLDVKKVQIRSDVFVSGANVSAVQIDPLLVGLGVGYRF